MALYLPITNKFRLQGQASSFRYENIDDEIQSKLFYLLNATTRSNFHEKSMQV